MGTFLARRNRSRLSGFHCSSETVNSLKLQENLTNVFHYAEKHTLEFWRLVRKYHNYKTIKSAKAIYGKGCF